MARKRKYHWREPVEPGKAGRATCGAPYRDGTVVYRASTLIAWARREGAPICRHCVKAMLRVGREFSDGLGDDLHPEDRLHLERLLQH